MTALVVIGAIALVVIAVPFAIYNRFVHLRNLTRESWRDIDTELQRRYDLIPNLVDAVEGYAAHERKTLEAVTAQRADAMATMREPDEQATRERALGGGVSQLMAVAERYPELRASEQFVALQRELADIEDRIQVARRIYNVNVRAYNTLVQTFPALVIARMFGFRVRPYFELAPIVRNAGPPPVDLSGPR